MRWILLGSYLLLTVGPVGAQLYSDGLLQAKQAKDSANLQFTVTELLSSASPEVRDKLRNVTVVSPARSPVDPDFPLGFFSNSAAQEIIIPVQSKKFFNDYLVLRAWFEKRGCDQTSVASYLAIVMTRRPESRSVGSPLDAFGVSESNAIQVQYVDSVSLGNLNSGMKFILAHELGHIYYGDGIADTLEDQIAREERADAFAMDILAAAHERPYGVVPLFSATRFNDPSMEHAPFGTHPLSHSRLDALAGRLRRVPEQFFSPQQDADKERERTFRLANEIDKIVVALRHEEFVRARDELVREYPPSTFKLACR
ncbi:hypothetical protein [Bradyrhizobium sp. AZCC 2230]|uniref:hypothetical protein n=1 Tax=Bradyrhizobium sp. AZCC 2230 TaxID=3117021 RepID=UPI002FF0BB5C